MNKPENDPTPDISVVIVNYNVADLLRNCLLSLQKSCNRLNLQVIVVDNASADESLAMLRRDFGWVTLLASEVNLGFSAGNNLALPHCRGKTVLLLNPDTQVQPNTLVDLFEYLAKHPEVGAVGPSVHLPDGAIQAECARNLPALDNLLPWSFQLDKLAEILGSRFGLADASLADLRQHPLFYLDRLNLLLWNREETCEVECLSGACMLIKSEVVQQIGPLDTSCPLYLDDIDYCCRIRKAGWQLHYLAGPRITHFWQKSTSQIKRQADLYAMSCHAHWLYLRKHGSTLQAKTFVAFALAAFPVRGAISALGSVASGGGAFWRRQLAMAWAMGRWAIRPKKTPDLGVFSS